jgi:poly-beta-1,6-N-acetyl-D-glucosamine synthase
MIPMRDGIQAPRHHIDLAGPLLHGRPIRPDGSALVHSVHLVICKNVPAHRELVLPRDASLPYVSILAPAYCEAACVKDAMSALVRLDYPAYEVIFVDDGSKDDTYLLASSFAGTHYSEHGVCHVRVFTKPNQGKWSAHNYGLRHASGNLILCIDADSRVETGALRLMVRHMRDQSVGAVSGQIRVRNRRSLAGLFQAFEYVLANGALRLAQGATGSVFLLIGVGARPFMRGKERFSAL